MNLSARVASPWKTSQMAQVAAVWRTSPECSAMASTEMEAGRNGEECEQDATVRSGVRYHLPSGTAATAKCRALDADSMYTSQAIVAEKGYLGSWW